MLTPPVADARLVADVDALLAEHGGDRSALLPVLQELRRRHGTISDAAMQLVAARLGMPPVEVLGVVTFYSFLRGGPARHVVRVCRTLTCELAGAPEVWTRLERELRAPAGVTTPDGAVVVERVHCIGRCDHAPAMLVDDRALDDVTPADAAALVARLRDETPAAGERTDDGVRPA